MDGLAEYLLTVVFLPALLVPGAAWALARAPRAPRPQAAAGALGLAVGAALSVAFVREVDLATAVRAGFGGGDPSLPVERWHSLGLSGAAVGAAAPLAAWAEARMGDRRWFAPMLAVVAAGALAALLRFPGTDAVTLAVVGVAVIAAAAMLRRLTLPQELAAAAVTLLGIGGAAAEGSFPSLGAIAASVGLGCGAAACVALLPPLRGAAPSVTLPVALATVAAILAWCGGAYADSLMPWWCFTLLTVAVPAAAIGVRAAWPGKGAAR